MRYLKHIKTIISLIVLIFPGYVNAQFKIVGYLRSQKNMVADFKTVDLKQITHLNIAFINPDTTGHINDITALDTIVNLAHKGNVKVLLSCGGGSRHAYYAKLLVEPQRRALINNFIAFIDKYHLDGIDVDIEGDDIDDNYENFVLDLKAPLVKRNKLLTAALAFYTRNRISDKALQSFDFVNLMAYDKTGPWRPTNPGQHSPISYALDHLNYWKNERGVDKKKLVIGVPFYGYGFGDLPNNDKTYQGMSYKDIIQKFPGAESTDEVNYENNGGTLYYNGMGMIKAKTELALLEAGGVMVWQLMGDTRDDKSLLKVINDTAFAKKELIITIKKI